MLLQISDKDIAADQALLNELEVKKKQVSRLDETVDTFEMHKTDQTGKGFPNIATREVLDNDTDGIMSPK